MTCAETTFVYYSDCIIPLVPFFIYCRVVQCRSVCDFVISHSVKLVCFVSVHIDAAADDCLMFHIL